MANDEWPGQTVADSLAAIISNDEVVIWKDFDAGIVGVEAGDARHELTPTEAEKLADGYEDTMEKHGSLGYLQTEEVVERLRNYAGEVAPYRDDAAEE